MFNRDYDLVPRTYSIKSYRRKGTSKFRKFFIYIAYLIIIIAVLGVTVLSLAHVI